MTGQGTVDAVVVAAQLVTALQAIVSRNVSPTESGVITLGKIDGGCAPNVIASKVRLRFTMASQLRQRVELMFLLTRWKTHLLDLRRSCQHCHLPTWPQRLL